MKGIFAKLLVVLSMSQYIQAVESNNVFNDKTTIGGIKDQLNVEIANVTGLGVQESDSEVEVLKRQAEKGNADAEYMLGLRHYLGKGVVENQAEAFKWWLRAAEHEQAAAQCLIGVVYANGAGVGKDMAEATRWLKKAAGQGNAEAQYCMGVIYDTGEGVAKDPIEAVKWYRSAVDKGHAKSQFNLGMMYRDGEGVEKNIKECVELLRKSAAQGFAPAQYNLAIVSGRILSLQKEGMQWLRRAAEQGFGMAQYNLAYEYSIGRGVEKNVVEAYAWCYLARENGVEEARQVLVDLEKKMKAQEIAKALKLVKERADNIRR